MESTISKIKFFVGKFFCRLLINFIGFMRRHSDDTTKMKIDKVVLETMIENITHINSYKNNI